MLASWLVHAFSTMHSEGLNISRELTKKDSRSFTNWKEFLRKRRWWTGCSEFGTHFLVHFTNGIAQKICHWWSGWGGVVTASTNKVSWPLLLSISSAKRANISTGNVENPWWVGIDIKERFHRSHPFLAINFRRYSYAPTSPRRRVLTILYWGIRKRMESPPSHATYCDFAQKYNPPSIVNLQNTLHIYC